MRGKPLPLSVRRSDASSGSHPLNDARPRRLDDAASEVVTDDDDRIASGERMNMDCTLNHLSSDYVRLQVATISNGARHVDLALTQSNGAPALIKGLVRLIARGLETTPGQSARRAKRDSRGSC